MLKDNPIVRLKAVEAVLIVNNIINFVKLKTEDLNTGLAVVRGKEANLNALLKINKWEAVVPVISIGNLYILKSVKENQNISKIEAVEEATIRLNLSNTNDNQSLELLNVNFKVE